MSLRAWVSGDVDTWTHSALQGHRVMLGGGVSPVEDADVACASRRSTCQADSGLRGALRHAVGASHSLLSPLPGTVAPLNLHHAGVQTHTYTHTGTHANM